MGDLRTTLVAFAVFAITRGADATSPRASGLAGARASALAGAVSADADDCTASYYNPANLAEGERSWLCVDYSTTLSSLEPRGQSAAGESIHTLEAGLASRGPLFGVPFGVGALLALPGARLSQIEAIRPEAETWVLDTNRPRIAFSAIAIGFRPLPRWSLGAALHLLAGVEGGFRVNGDLAQPNVHDSQLTHSVDADLVSTRSFAASLAWTPSDSSRLALVYRHRAQLSQRIDGDLSGNLGTAGLLLPARYVARSEVAPASFPSALVLAAHHELGRFGIAAELTWEDFSSWVSPDGRSEGALTIGDVPVNLNGGAPRAPLLPSPHDRFVARIGFEARALEAQSIGVRLRAGYAFEPSPFPARETARWLDSDRHSLAAGAGLEHRFDHYVLRGDLFGLIAFLPERDAVRASELGARVTASGTRFSFGASALFGF